MMKKCHDENMPICQENTDGHIDTSTQVAEIAAKTPKIQVEKCPKCQDVRASEIYWE